MLEFGRILQVTEHCVVAELQLVVVPVSKMLVLVV